MDISSFKFYEQNNVNFIFSGFLLFGKIHGPRTKIH